MKAALPQRGVSAEPAPERTVAVLLQVMADLTSTLREENDLLRRGLPAVLSPTTERKKSLNHAFATTWKEVRAVETGAVPDQIPGLDDRLVSSARDLVREAQENARRLQAATTATQRRIAVVMEAIRAQDNARRPYGPAGIAAAPMIAGRHRLGV